jgi:hypothetical protein
MAFLGWQWEEPYLLMRGLFNGGEKTGRHLLSPLLNIACPQKQLYLQGSYSQVDAFLHESPAVPQVPDLARQEKESRYVDRPIETEDWLRVAEHLLRSPNSSSLLAIEPYGGAISAVKVADTAFIHREVDMNMYVDVFWMTASERRPAIKFLDDMMALFDERKLANGSANQNYPRPDQDEYQMRFWGAWLGVLASIKKKYDPQGFFGCSQIASIRADTPKINGMHDTLLADLKGKIEYERYAFPII